MLVPFDSHPHRLTSNFVGVPNFRVPQFCVVPRSAAQHKTGDTLKKFPSIFSQICAPTLNRRGRYAYVSDKQGKLRCWKEFYEGMLNRQSIKKPFVRLLPSQHNTKLETPLKKISALFSPICAPTFRSNGRGLYICLRHLIG